MTLEQLFKEACAKGMTHFTIYPVQSLDRKTTYWCARATPSTGHSYVQTQTLDPIEAITQTLMALPKAPKRASKVKIGHDFGTEPATATVTEPDKPQTAEDWMPKA